MPPVPETSARPADPAVTNDYDSFAEAYSAENEASLLNAYYERPAMLALAGDVAGRRILDAGCGSGPLFAALRDRGAIVTGFDSSAKMLQLARRRLGPAADLHLADLGSPLPFPDAAFDDVIACLVLHYLQDWTAPLAELRRVLRPGGRLLFAEHGRAPEAGVARWQDRLTPIWRRLAGGCHLNRKPDDLIHSAGFSIESLETGYLKGPRPMGFVYAGSASAR